ncbi:MAG: hypothetical protein IJY61_05040 [Candidatus Gastranaerophilales bacterium]|nr:hypothetical protein [Candidatus Gastranaerophilales bacterium]
MRISLNTFNNYSNIVKNAITSPFRPSNTSFVPLKADTVSFSGSAKLVGGDMKFAPTDSLCRQVSENAEPARFLLETILDNYLGQYKFDSKRDNPKEKPIQDIKTRKKSSSSIREKVVSKYSKCTNSEGNAFAETVFNSLSANFPMSPTSDPKVVLDDIKRATKYSYSEDIRMSPYANVDMFFDDIIAELQLYGHFDFNAVSEQRRDVIFNLIKSDLKAANDDAHHIEGRFYDPTIVKGIKHWANDIIGGRVIMREPGPEYTGIVLDGLMQAVNDGVLKITSIENNVPNPDKIPTNKKQNDYVYATNKQLQALADAANAPLIENVSKSGYLSVHIDIALDDKLLEMYNGVFEGFSGEIQIIGEDVLKLKEVEDLCYKLKDNKNAIHVDYKPFIDYFTEYYKGDDVKKAFDDYTYALYLSQRAIPSNSGNNYFFPSIAELGFADRVPEELDFNKLRKIKEYCDIKHEETQKKEKEEYDRKMLEKKPVQRMKKHRDINTVKKAITYTYS